MNRIHVRHRRIARRGPSGLPIAAVLIACLVGRPLSAQVVEDGDSVPRFNMDSVVVNVMKTPIRIIESPYTVSVAGAEDLREGKTGMFLEEALETLPGVQVQNRFNYAVGERVSIRGFGSRAQFGVRGIHVEVDGIPATLPDGQSTLDHVDIGSLGRVEALRGPASALYGNASGGVLRFETEVPSRSPFREEATSVVGSDGLVRLQSVSGGTVGTTGYLLSVDRLDYDGYRHDFNGDPYGKAKRLHIVGRLEQDMAGGQLGVTVNHLNLDAENPGSLRLDLFEDDPDQVFRFAYTNFLTRKEVQQSQIGATWDGPVGALTLKAAAYGLNRDFFNPLPGDIADVDRRAGGARVTLGGQTSSGDLTIDVHAGVQGDFQNDDRREFDNNAGKPDTLRLNETEKVRSLGSFVQTSLTFVDRVTLMGALRYDHTYFEVDDLYPVSATNADDSGSRDMDKVSPSVGVHVQVTPEFGVFTNFATSFETPTTVELGNRPSGAGGFNPNLEPMNGKTFEGGLRGTWLEPFGFDIPVSIEWSAFHTRLENELIPYEIATAPGLTYYRNAGSSTRDGAEFILRVEPQELVTVQGSVNYVDAKFDDYLVDGVNLGTDCPAALPSRGSCKVPGLAPWQGQGSVRVGPSAWFVEFATEYTSSMEVNDVNIDNVVAGQPLTSSSAKPTDAYWLFDVRVGGNQLELGRFQVSPFAGLQNIFDETYVSSVAINAFGSRFYEPGPGRTFYVGATVAVAR